MALEYSPTRILGSSIPFFVSEAEKMGFDGKAVLQIFAQTMKGSAEMTLDSGESPKDLEKKLLLPGAATLAAIDKMVEVGFDKSIEEGVQACVKQAKVLGKM